MKGILVLFVAIGVAPVLADETAPRQEPLTEKIVVTGIEGMVEVRFDEDQPWRKAAVGLEAPPGAEFRTGPRSAVRLTIGQDQTLTLDRLGVVKVLRATVDEQARRATTDVGMPYGRTRYDLHAGEGFEHDATIHTPGNTLSIRGTKISILSQGSRIRVHSLAGNKPRSVTVKDELSKHAVVMGQQSQLNPSDGTPAQTAQKNTVVDSIDSRSRTATESGVVTQKAGSMSMTTNAAQLGSEKRPTMGMDSGAGTLVGFTGPKSIGPGTPQPK